MKSNNKRICFLTTLPVTLKTFVYPQTEYLLRNGWDVTWICAEDSHFRDRLPNGVRYISMPFKRGVDILGVPCAIFALYRLFKTERFDLVQYSTPNAAFYASTAARLARVPVRIYAQWGIRYVGFAGIARSFLKLLERWCCLCATVVEPDSFSNLSFSIREGLYPKGKGHVIWHGSACGINLSRFDFTKKDIWRALYRKKLGYNSQHRVIGFVGSIRRDKGCNELIAACRSFFPNMPEARLLLIGDEDFLTTIDRDLLDWSKSTKQVTYIPPNKEIPQYMACMDVFALPSYREGFGLVVAEAEAMGVPVVVSNVPGPIDAMRDMETGLIVPVRNSEALSNALQTILNDEGTRVKYANAAAAFVRENFEQGQFMRYLLEDKEQLLKKSIMAAFSKKPA